MLGLAALTATDAYRRRQPERSLLYQTVSAHLQTFLAQATVPAFVARAFRRYLDCGILAKGFLRVVCAKCGHESLVAFSCKDRGFCPSCTARHGAQTAAHLVDEVLPHVPYRQWVLAMPFDLHHRLARNEELERKVLAIFIDEIDRYLHGAATAGQTAPSTADGDAVRERAGKARAGFFTATQHFGSSLNVHVHFHVLATEGRYEQTPEGSIEFLRTTAPTQEDLTGAVGRVAARVRRLVGKPDANEEPIVQEPALRALGAEPREAEERSLAVEQDGFNLHAALALEADQRTALERLCRYMMRGPLASGRLRQGPQDKLVYKLKTPRADGTTHIVLSPMALLQRLSWLCVLPRAHTTHYHGVLAPAHPWRSLVVPKKTTEAGTAAVPLKGCNSKWIDWADLLRHVFLTDVMVCQICGGKRRIIAKIDEGPIARKILAHLGLATEAPSRTPARAQEQLDAWCTGPPGGSEPEAPECDEQPPPFDFDQRIPASDLFV